MTDTITLSKAEHMELTRRASSRTDRAEDARRARLILLLAEGHTWDEASERIDCSRGFVASWSKRFSEQRLAGLYSRHMGQVATVLTPALEARILERTRRAPSATTHWTTRTLAGELGISHMMVSRVWRKHGLKPHRVERYMASNDPDFEKKAADIIGLYLNPPAHAAVFCVDEKTAIQALDRKDPVLPLSPGRAERHGFEYFRHGTLSLYAAFNTKTGEVLGKTAERHTSAEFVAFLADIVINQRAAKKSMSSLTISRRTRASRSKTSWSRTRRSICTSRRPIRPGSTRSSCGSARSSAMSSPGACSRPCPI